METPLGYKVPVGFIVGTPTSDLPPGTMGAPFSSLYTSFITMSLLLLEFLLILSPDIEIDEVQRRVGRYREEGKIIPERTC